MVRHKYFNDNYKSVRIHDMKFVKQGLRQRQSKWSASQAEQENLVPCAHPKAKQQQPCTHMDQQPIEKGRKQEQQYLEEIIEFMAHASDKNQAPPDYFKNQPDISEHMRSVLLSWLVDVNLKYKLQPETLFMSIHIIDAYLARVVVPRGQLQLVGIVATWIASKYEETYQVPKIQNLICICDSAYTREQILQMESQVIQILDFNLLVNTQHYYFQALQQVANLNPKDYFLCRYILEICLFDLHFRSYHPKVLAASAVYFVRKLRKNAVCWYEKQQQMFAVGEGEIKQCAREMCLYWQKAQEIQTLSSLRNKFQSSHYKEVSKIKVRQALKTHVPAPVHLRA